MAYSKVNTACKQMSVFQENIVKIRECKFGKVGEPQIALNTEDLKLTRPNWARRVREMTTDMGQNNRITE